MLCVRISLRALISTVCVMPPWLCQSVKEFHVKFGQVFQYETVDGSVM